MAGRELNFTFVRYEPEDQTSIAAGKIQLSAYGEFPQYFSDKSNSSPVEADELVGVRIDPKRSRLDLTEGADRDSIELTCNSATSVLHGKSSYSEVFLILSHGGAVVPRAEPSASRITLDSPIPDLVFDGPSLTMAEALAVLKQLSWCDRGWLAQQQAAGKLDDVAACMRAIKTLSKGGCKAP